MKSDDGVLRGGKADLLADKTGRVGEVCAIGETLRASATPIMHQTKIQCNSIVSIHLHSCSTYAIMLSMERKVQQQTLSIRISDALREYLERAKNVLSSSRGDGVSTSDVAKMLLESAKDDRLDHRLEVADLQQNTAQSLWNIRRKWEQRQGLSHAEWLFVAQYIQVGCEELAEDPEHPTPESFAQVLEAFLAVRALRVDRGVELDRYYLGNLGLTDGATLNQRQLDPEVVPNVTGNLIQEAAAFRAPAKAGVLRPEPVRDVARRDSARSRRHQRCTHAILADAVPVGCARALAPGTEANPRLGQQARLCLANLPASCLR